MLQYLLILFCWCLYQNSKISVCIQSTYYSPWNKNYHLGRKLNVSGIKRLKECMTALCMINLAQTSQFYPEDNSFLISVRSQNAFLLSFYSYLFHFLFKKGEMQNLSDLADEMYMLAHNLHFNYAFRIKMEICSEVWSCDSNVSLSEQIWYSEIQATAERLFLPSHFRHPLIGFWMLVYWLDLKGRDLVKDNMAQWSMWSVFVELNFKLLFKDSVK